MATRVLVADDSKTIRKAIELTFMAKEDFELTFASSYDEMVSALSGAKPDMLIVDMGILPAGYDTLKELRTTNDGLRILAMHSIHSQFDESRKDTCHAYIAKPFLTENMIARVEEVAAMPVAPIQEPASPEPVAPKPSSPEPEHPKKAPAAPAAPSSAAPVKEEKAVSTASPKKAAVLPLKNRKTLKKEEEVPAVTPPRPQSQEEEEVLVIEAEPPEEAAPAIDFTIFSKNAPAEPKTPEKTVKPASHRIPAGRARAQTMLYSGPPPVPGQGFPGLGDTPEPKKEPAPGVPQPAAEEKSEVTARTEPVESQSPVSASSVASSAVEEVVKQAAQKGPEYEAIANLSREVIERIAWEVVPQLSEVIIREIIRKQGLPKS